jgi:hypothetical protein
MRFVEALLGDALAPGRKVSALVWVLPLVGFWVIVGMAVM